ncbi:hypothetical protein ACDX39_22265, partial [Pseudomonas aeruginosa]
ETDDPAAFVEPDPQVDVGIRQLPRRGGGRPARPPPPPPLDAFGKLFDQGRLPLPDGLREVPLEQGVEQYRAVNEGTCEKIILVP